MGFRMAKVGPLSCCHRRRGSEGRERKKKNTCLAPPSPSVFSAAAFHRRQSRSAETAAVLKMKAALFKVFFAIQREKRAEREREGDGTCA